MEEPATVGRARPRR
uniref:Uncharacterized protein n=1 Tax=Oryza rufipogon TaxID=4529 RepID=A0A0E0PCR1_ORYRU